MIDRQSLVPYKGHMLHFLNRSKTGYDWTVSDEVIMREMFLEDVYQAEDAKLDDTKKVMDIGGNIGAFDVQAVCLGAEEVYTFEPEDENFKMLEENITMNGMKDRIFPIKKAITADGKKVKIIPAQGATSVENIKNIDKSMNVPKDRQVVESLTLKEAFETYCPKGVDILKIDCEGSEYDIINSTPSKVLNLAQFITMEFHINSKVEFGKMIAKLTLTHNVHIVGKYNKGGQVYARRY